MANDFEVTEYGLMSPLLEVSILSDLCVSDGGVQTGPFGSLLHKKDYVDQGTPIITVEHLGENRIIHSNTPYVSDADKERLSKYSLQTGDIVFSRVGSVDRRSLVRGEEDGWLFSGRCLRVRANEQLIDPAYLSYFFGFEGFKNSIRGIAVGATMPSINTKILSDVRVFYPRLNEQKVIAHILGTLDDKIELNRQMNETLEAMAQALFKSWFVDFDPVIDNALLAGKAIPEPFKERAKMRQAQLDSGKANTNSEINDLFPSEFEFTEELGWIPKGWKVGSLSDITFVKGGYAFKSRDFSDKGFPVIKIKNINDDRTININDVQYIPEDIAKKSKNFFLETGDLIMAMTGATVGKFGLMVSENKQSYLLNQRVAKFTSVIDQINKAWFTYCFLNQKSTIDYITNIAEGSAQPNISASTIMATPLVVPSAKIIISFDSLIDGYFSKIILNQQEIYTVTKLRDTLLPKLMSGELRIPDAEKLVADI